MEKWKILVIIFLLGGLAGLGVVQSQLANRPAQPPITAGNQVQQEERLPVMDLEGQPAPAWNIPAKYWMNTKEPLDVQSFKGNVTLVEFFRIECSHCQESVPFMKYLNKTYGPKGLKIVGIQSPGVAETENDWKTVQDRVREWQLTYPIAFDEQGQLFKTKYNGTNYPTLLLIDPNGSIRYIHSGHTEEKAAKLEAAIKMGLNMKR
ncbi:MAG TPA: redoxin family protein [Abditibacteriaceae bacterium]|jgi:thiol-disulfide isomerase/thioredoxin